MASSATPAATSSFSQRWFYTIATVALLGLTLAGFHHFYFKGMAYPGRPLTPPIKSLVIAHALAMSLWMLLALAQPMFVALGNKRLHRALGAAGAILALALVALGLKLATASCQVSPPGMMFGPLTPKQFMAIPVMSALAFAAFVAAGIVWRNRPATHKPMMLLATLAAVSAGIARIDPLNHLYQGGLFDRVFGVFFFSVLFGAGLVVAKSWTARKFDRALAFGWGAYALWAILTTRLAPTPAWDFLANLLLG
jgi:hypothetical protein